MRLRNKILLSIGLQCLFVYTIPQVFYWVFPPYYRAAQEWRKIREHEIFSSTIPKKVAFIGTSFWGIDQCGYDETLQIISTDSVCQMANLMESKIADYPLLKDFDFFDVSRGGTKAALHLHVFLNLLALNDGSLRYIFYDIPQKLEFEKQLGDYRGINKALLVELKQAQLKSHVPELEKISNRLVPYLDQTKPGFGKQSLSEFLERRLKQRDWLRDLNVIIRHELWESSSELYVEIFLRDQLVHEAEANKARFTPIKDFGDGKKDVFETEEDFWMIDLMAKLCQERGIQFVLYKPPIYRDPEQVDWYTKRIFNPVLAHLKNRNIRFLDYSDLPFEYPHDTFDGLHPSLTTKLVMAKRLLSDLEKFENEKSKK